MKPDLDFKIKIDGLIITVEYYYWYYNELKQCKDYFHEVFKYSLDSDNSFDMKISPYADYCEFIMHYEDAFDSDPFDRFFPKLENEIKKAIRKQKIKKY